MKKATVYYSFSLILVNILSGCQHPLQDSKNEEKTAVTIVYSTKLEHVETLIEENLSDIDFQYERALFASPSRDILRRLDTDQGPDLIVSTQPASQDSKQYVLPLGGYAFSARYESTIIQSLSVDDSIYYLPFPAQYNGYIINKTLFDEIGLPLPQTNKELIQNLLIFCAQVVEMSDTGYVFGMLETNDMTLGNFLVSCMVPDFLAQRLVYNG